MLMLGRSCEKADCACLKCICDVEQLYTDAALVLDTSTRVASAAEERRDVDLWGKLSMSSISPFLCQLFSDCPVEWP